MLAYSISSWMNVHLMRADVFFIAPMRGAYPLARYLVLYYTSCNLNIIDNINVLSYLWIAAVVGDNYLLPLPVPVSSNTRIIYRDLASIRPFTMLLNFLPVSLFPQFLIPLDGISCQTLLSRHQHQ